MQASIVYQNKVWVLFAGQQVSVISTLNPVEKDGQHENESGSFSRETITYSAKF